MNEIIKMEDGNAVMSLEFMAHMLDVKDQLKKLKEIDDANTEMLLEAMEKHHLIKFENDAIVVNYIAPTDFESFDSKEFRKDHADLYDEYVHIKEKKAYIKVNAKKV